MPHHLVPATADDLEFVVELKEHAMREELESIGRWDTDRSRARITAAFSPVHTRLIEVDGERVGSISVRPDGDITWIQMFYLHERVRGSGIGTAILREVLAEIGDRPVHLEVLTGSRARALYERHGFVFTSTDGVDDLLIR